MKWKWLLSKDEKYLYPEGRPNLRADLNGNVYGGDFLFGGDDEETKQESTQTTTQAPPQFSQAPEYPEATGARSMLWKKAQEWGNMPGYGAIAPDWGDIWNKAQARINRFYWGGPAEGGGLVGKVRASAARRNVSQSPALEEQIKQMGMGQGLQLGEMATEQAKTEAAFGEQGRTNWLNTILALSGMKPQVASYTPSATTTGMTTTTQPSQGIFAPLMGMAGSLIGQNMNQDWLSTLLKGMNLFGGGEGNSGIGYGEGGFGEFNLPSSILG